MEGDRQHATIFPCVRSNRLMTNCSPIPREAPLITNTAFGSEFRLSELFSLFVLLRLLKSIWGKTGWPCDSGGMGALNEAAIADDDDDDDDEECDRAGWRC